MMHEKYATRGQPLTLAKLVAHYSGSSRASRYEIDGTMVPYVKIYALDADATLLMAATQQRLPQYHEIGFLQGERIVAVHIDTGQCRSSGEAACAFLKP